MAAKTRNRRNGLTPAKRKALVTAYEATGVYARVSEACNVPEATFQRWRREDATLQDELDEAAERLDRRIFGLARCRVLEHLEEVGTSPVVETRETVVDGAVVALQTRRRVELNVGVLHRCLNRIDPRWTRQHTDAAAVGETLVDVVKRLAEDVPSEPG